MRYVPSLPRSLRKRTAPPLGRWSMPLPPVPDRLRSVAGIHRDLAIEEDAFAREPLRDWMEANREPLRWYYRHHWRYLLPVAPRLSRALAAVRSTDTLQARVNPPQMSAHELTSLVRQHAKHLGLSSIGIAAYDPKYTFAEYQGSECGQTVVVCVLEQNYAATQTLPSSRCDRAIFSTYADLMQMTAKLAQFVASKGHRARAYDDEGAAVVLHYAVEAGLGQLGLNGQLLTPAAGSRCRICLMITDAPLMVDRPVDYGLTKICDACRACVERCPVGAIPAKRTMHRGVMKARINVDRCFPAVAQVHNCGICMKVCPIQRYGLRAVLEEFEGSGRILGKGTDELEGYDWPLDGRHYAPGQKPRLQREFFERTPDDRRHES